MSSNASGGADMALKLERFKQVMDRTGLARATIYRRIQEGTFPQPVKIGTRSVAWPSAVIDDWIRGCTSDH